MKRFKFFASKDSRVVTIEDRDTQAIMNLSEIDAEEMQKGMKAFLRIRELSRAGLEDSNEAITVNIKPR